MRFLLRITFWLSVVLVLLPNSGSQSVPKSQVSAAEVVSAAKDVITDTLHICDRQQEVCVVGSRTAVAVGQRVEAGAKTVLELLREHFGSSQLGSERSTELVPLPPAKPLHDTLRPADLMAPWQGTALSDTRSTSARANSASDSRQ
jgi:Family of unknown function (DUF5330)